MIAEKLKETNNALLMYSKSAEHISFIILVNINDQMYARRLSPLIKSSLSSIWK